MQVNNVTNSDRYIFRGKRKDNGEWVFGTLFYNDGEYLIGCLILSTEDSYKLMEIQAYPVQEETIGQCIGFRDSKKQKIFDGDIVRCGDRKMYVHFNPDSLEYEMTDVGIALKEVNFENTVPLTRLKVGTDYGIKEYIVIGNLWDDAEG